MNESVTIGRIEPLSAPDSPIAQILAELWDYYRRGELDLLTRPEIQKRARCGKDYFFNVIEPHLVKHRRRNGDRYTLESYEAWLKRELVDHNNRPVYKREAKHHAPASKEKHHAGH